MLLSPAAVAEQPAHELLVGRLLDTRITASRILTSVAGSHQVLALEVGAVELVAKIFRDSAAASRLWHNLRRLSEATFRELIVPEPVAWDAATGVVVMTMVGGRPFGERPSRRTLQSAGRVLAELHYVVPIADDEPKCIAEDLAELVRPQPLALAEALPRWADTIQVTLDSLAALGPPARPTAVHRDFHLRQLLADGDRIGVVDWDLLADGDPAFDVAYLTTYLETHGLGADASRAFLAGYRELGPWLCPDRLRLYRRFNLLRRACRRHRLADHGWLQQIDHLLQLLAADLAQNGIRPR